MKTTDHLAFNLIFLCDFTQCKCTFPLKEGTASDRKTSPVNCSWGRNGTHWRKNVSMNERSSSWMDKREQTHTTHIRFCMCSICGRQTGVKGVKCTLNSLFKLRMTREEWQMEKKTSLDSNIYRIWISIECEGEALWQHKVCRRWVHENVYNTKDELTDFGARSKERPQEV